MKKLIFLFSLVAVMLLGSTTEAQAQNTQYDRVCVYDSLGVNTTDFIFTYDNNNDCVNNIIVVNNLDVVVMFNFKVYINGAWRYSGQVIIGVCGQVYFNNAYKRCNSPRDEIKVVCY